MFTSATIENFRGIERLKVDGLGRVNLIIGKNNSGKTALMEALTVLKSQENAAETVAVLQGMRMRGSVEPNELEAFWLPVFRGGNAERGFTLGGTLEDGDELRIEMHRRRDAAPMTAVDLSGESPNSSVWSLEYVVSHQGRRKSFETTGTARGVIFPPHTRSEASTVAWVPASPLIIPDAVRLLSRLKQQGSDSEALRLLQLLDARIQALEILSPTGRGAFVFVRTADETMLLPLQSLGEGVQKCFDIAVSVVKSQAAQISMDEIENGLHHSVMLDVWKWLAEFSSRQRIQIFATTHSEECVYAACKAFIDLGDDGLKVIRLDRQEHETEAKVYDRDLVSATERMDIEIRG